MATITIPKKLIKNNDLIIVPRKETGEVFGPFNSVKTLKDSLEK